MFFRPFATALFAAAALLPLSQAGAQNANSPQWFIPGQSRRAGPTTEARPPAAPAPPASPLSVEQPAAGQALPAEQLRVQLPPAPSVPDVPRGAMPPAAVIGVLSIPDALRISTAYVAADKALAERRQKLNEDAQKEQATLRELAQQLANDRAKLSAAQIRDRERELQDRITESRRKFTERNTLIQQAGQYALAQIERTLSDVVQKVAASHAMNLVIQRNEVALNAAEFDLTQQVAELLNKTLPSVVLPPEGVSPLAMHPAGEPGAQTAERTSSPPAGSGAAAAPARQHPAPQPQHR